MQKHEQKLKQKLHDLMDKLSRGGGGASASPRLTKTPSTGKFQPEALQFHNFSKYIQQVINMLRQNTI